MSDFLFTCVFNDTSITRKKVSAKIRAKTTSANAIKVKVSSSGKLRERIGKEIACSAKLSSSPKLKASLTSIHLAASAKLSNVSNIKSSIITSNCVKSSIKGKPLLNVKYADRIGGDLTQINSIPNFQSTQRLFPIQDITTSYNGNSFVDNLGNNTNLYTKIDEGVYTGNYQENGNESYLISDDIDSFIQPSAILTDGTFRYKCEVTAPTSTPLQSFLFMRASAPMKNYASSMPPSYKLYNIVFADPSGNTIVQYDDITVKGDSNYRDVNDVNFSTYISSPKINNINKPTWDDDYPLFGEPSGYTLSFDLDILCKDIGFGDRFGDGYLTEACSLPDSLHDSNDYLSLDGSPLSTRTQGFINPSDHIRISAIELANSGTTFGFSVSQFLSAYVKTDEKGERIDRNIYPSEMQLSSFDTEIYPQSTTVWQSNDTSHDNTSISGCQEITSIIRSYNDEEYINLTSTSVADSGKLIVKFGHEPPLATKKYIAGEFNINFGQPIREFNYARYRKVEAADSYFLVDEVYLKVIAKKDIGTPDYTFDVVGYSFDHLLYNSPSVGGFLQNVEGAGSIPTEYVSGVVNDLGISTEPLSNKHNLQPRFATASSGGDHYVIATSPVVDSTSFEEYLVPLKVYRESSFGKVPNYNVSSYFENLFLDICPLPVGASIASVVLLIRHKPSNAIPLHTIGHENGVDLGRESSYMFPSDRKDSDPPINFGNDNYPLSTINDIPAGYTYEDSTKSNYSRRWRGVDGLVAVGPFSTSVYQNPGDERGFDFAFYNPQLKAPFLGGYYSFNDDNAGQIISEDLYLLPSITGQYIGNYNKLQNLGLRFKNDQLFNSGLTQHTTIDWTSISANASDPLNGKIADAFDNAVRVSGVNGYITFDDFDVTSGVIIFARFSPDENMIGGGYNLFNSGVLFSKYNSGKDLEFSLGYDNGYLTAKATDDLGNVITIQDSLYYTNYSYPLSVVLTYNNADDGVLSLYTDNEIDSTDFNRLRATSSTFQIVDSDSSFDVGYSSGDGVGVNAFITDLAISSPNLYYDDNAQLIPMSLSMNVSSFLDSIHTKYWSGGESAADDTNEISRFINKNTDEWHLGAFSVCLFDKSFDRFKSRFGKDFISHRVKNDGQAYSSYVDTSISSDVDDNTSYHTQIENDFLRVNLSSPTGSFSDSGVLYSLAPRISKTFPRGYNFVNDAVSVDSIIEHITTDDILWSDGEIGPKLIVSLYATNKDSDLRSESNIGLINRSVHYIPPSACIHKITSSFSIDDLLNTDSEAWSDYDQSLNKTEFVHKFFSEDVQSMFLQYDVVYPSGTAYDSTINIYGSRVKFQEPFHNARTLTNM